ARVEAVEVAAVGPAQVDAVVDAEQARVMATRRRPRVIRRDKERSMRRVLVSAFVSAAVALVATLPISGQSGGGVPPIVITAYNGGAPIPYTTPKTPWGDPDLQGVWSSDDASMPTS